jgi:hypothetical protein
MQRASSTFVTTIIVMAMQLDHAMTIMMAQDGDHASSQH